MVLRQKPTTQISNRIFLSVPLAPLYIPMMVTLRTISVKAVAVNSFSLLSKELANQFIL